MVGRHTRSQGWHGVRHSGPSPSAYGRKNRSASDLLPCSTCSASRTLPRRRPEPCLWPAAPRGTRARIGGRARTAPARRTRGGPYHAGNGASRRYHSRHPRQGHHRSARGARHVAGYGRFRRNLPCCRSASSSRKAGPAISKETRKWCGCIWGKIMLKVRSLESGYAKLRVLKSVSLHVNPGEIVGIIGANGAGKPRCSRQSRASFARGRAISYFSGASLLGIPAHGVVSRGCVLVPEGRQVFRAHDGRRKPRPRRIYTVS